MPEPTTGPTPLSTASPLVVRYAVKVTGHVAPYRWAVLRSTGTRASIERASQSTISDSSCQGLADSYEQAVSRAYKAASEVERKRLHAETVYTEELFTTLEKPPEYQRTAPSQIPDSPPAWLRTASAERRGGEPGDA